MTITSVRHAGIVVSDMSASLRFYHDLLGMEVWADFTDSSEYVQRVTAVPGADIRMVKLRAADGVLVELLQYRSHPQSVPAPMRACDVGINHLALAVDDVDSVYAKLSAAAIQFHCPPGVSPDGGAKVTYCRDPERVIVELVQIL